MDKQQELRQVLQQFRDLVPQLMSTLMVLGRDELILADKVHQIDTKARVVLAEDTSRSSFPKSHRAEGNNFID